MSGQARQPADHSPTAVLIGTLDTKGEELGYVRERLCAAGVRCVLIDVGIRGRPLIEPDIQRQEVAAAGGLSMERLAASDERGEAVETMAQAAATIVLALHREGRCDGVLGAGGGSNTAIATTAMRALPIGVPKLMISTLTAGDTRPFVGVSDLILMHPVIDVAGINRISRQILANGAAAMAGMLAAPAIEFPAERPLIAASMFGVTTPCVTAAREQLEAGGYEVITFHATGAGGRAMEALVAEGHFAGVLDVTTTELCDELVGGVLSAGPDRLTAAGQAGLPQVVSLGALDMVNFGPRETVPSEFSGRRLSQHNRQTTLMRTSAAECAQLGAEIASKLSRAKGPTALFLPLRGLSALSVEGGAFHDPDADEALFRSLRAGLADHIDVYECDTHINDSRFAQKMAATLVGYLEKGTK